jgi:hypothetical protein
MAQPGVGFRTACDLLCEVSLHLLQSPVNTTITSVVGPGGYGTGGYGGMPPPPPDWGYGSGPPEVITVVSLESMYVGAMIVVGWGLDTAEVVTITGISYAHDAIYTTPFVNSHSAGETILSPTFPYEQENGDPAYSQSEVLGYLSRSQNEYLADCPMYYQISTQSLTFGQIFNNTPANCIEINRLAISQTYIAVASLSRTSYVVTLTSVDPHGLGVGSTIFVQNSTIGWGGVFEVLTAPSPTTLTYSQIEVDGATTGGAILYWNRAYETTQTEITQTNRTWQNGYVTSPNQWFEDRSGLYRFGVGGKPASNYPVELLCSIRDTDTLGLLDGFLVPDLLVGVALKYKTLAFCWSKDGICQDPARARYCEMRYQKAVAATQRFLEGFSLGVKQEMANA